MTAVVIVGAGPTGLTAATLLGQYGVECLVLDRWESIYPRPRAVHLDDEIYRLLARLGLRDAFAAISRPCRGLRLVDARQRVLAEFARGAERGRHGYPEANMFDQPDLEAILRANLERHPTVTVRGNAEVTGLAQEDGRVRVDVTDRITGARDTVRAGYALGCDGAGSLTRASIGASLLDLRFTQRWLVVDVATDADLAQWEGVHQVCDPVRAATYMRIGETRYRWEFRLLPGETAEDYGDLARLHPLIAPWTGDIPLGRLEFVRVAGYTFRAQVADRWRDRRVFLLGDAAHLSPPFIGQGMCAGLRDAANLAWKLAGVLSGDLPETVLDTYQTEREPHARAMIRLARLIGTAMTAGGELGNLLRGVLAPRLHLLPGLSDQILSAETPALRRSSLVLRPRRRRGLAGQLCPNATLALTAPSCAISVEGGRMSGWLDVHAHYVTDHYVASCRGAGLGRPDGMPGLPEWSAEASLDVMAKAGVAAAVLSVSSPGVHFGGDSLAADPAARALAEHVNDSGARVVARWPDRFGLSAVLPLPDVGGALAELTRAHDGLGADAIALLTNYHGRYLTDPAFAPVLAALDERASVVTLHPTSPPGWERTALGRPRPMIEFAFDTTRCVVDLALSGSLARYPRIRWIVPHAGAVLPTLAHRVAGMSLLTGAPADLPAILGGLYYDLAGAALPVALDALLAVAGPDRLLYGSDFPFTPAAAVEHLAGGLRRAPALRGACLGAEPGTPAAALFPRLIGVDR